MSECVATHQVSSPASSIHNTKKDNFIIIVFLRFPPSSFVLSLSISVNSDHATHPPTPPSPVILSDLTTFLLVCVVCGTLRIVREGVFYGSNLITSGVHFQEVVGRNFQQIGKSESQHSAGGKVKSSSGRTKSISPQKKKSVNSVG